MIRIFCLVSFLFAISINQQSYALSKYPYVSELNGKIQSITKEGENLTITKGTILKDRATILTGNKSQVQIELDPKTVVILLDNSSLEIPNINQDGDVSTVILNYGQARIATQGSGERIYATPLTRDIYPSADFLLSYDRDKARAEVLCFKNGLKFRGQEHEQEAYVGPGERVFFQGIFDGGQLAFDILLKGRKVARGTLSKVERLSEIELNEIEKSTWIKKPEAPKKAKAKPRKSDEICDNPFGKLNQCVWKCENNPKKAKTCAVGHTNSKAKCVRYRCLANGQWSDPFELTPGQNKCKLSPIVGPCDY
ncbi:MAG: hypothetical protein BroJett040_11390 [Oligoflexia bacterium]|nr:MAG: hypothetical protein BroJett040_11390 [Oligoflexia bacterium]